MTRGIEQAAAEIVALIQSRPASPTVAEIAEVLGRIGTPAVPMSPAHAALYLEWRALMEEHARLFGGPDPEHATDAEREAEEERLGAHLDTIDALAFRILATPVRAWGDVALYAEICFWANWRGVDSEGPEAAATFAARPHSTDTLSDAGLAKLIEAVLSLAGIRRPLPPSGCQPQRLGAVV